MTDEELAKLNVDELKKRRRGAKLLVTFCFGLFFGITLYAALKGKLLIAVVTAPLLATIIPLMAGLKRIEAELNERKKE